MNAKQLIVFLEDFNIWFIAWHLHDSPLRWRHNDRDGVWNHQPRDCLLNRLFRRRSKETSKLCVTGLCAANSPGTGEFSAQMASYAENVSIWWRHNDISAKICIFYHNFVDRTPFPKSYWVLDPHFSTLDFVQHCCGIPIFKTGHDSPGAKPLPEPILTYCQLDP